MLQVNMRPELIQALNHKLTFAKDEVINDYILKKYGLWSYLTPCDADNSNILNDCIQQWRDKANQLYETTLYNYDPLINYKEKTDDDSTRTPDLTDERTPDLTDETAYGRTDTHSATGYDIPRTLADDAKNTAAGSDTLTHTGTDTYTHTGTETVTRDIVHEGLRGASQDLIKKQREIIIDCLDWYVDKFKQCFNVSMSVLDYTCCGAAAFVPEDCGGIMGVMPESVVDKKLSLIDNQLGAIVQRLDDCCETMTEEIDGLKKSVSDSKALLAGAITEKGVSTADDATFQTMADNITAISTGIDVIHIFDYDIFSIRNPRNSFVEVS